MTAKNEILLKDQLPLLKTETHSLIPVSTTAFDVPIDTLLPPHTPPFLIIDLQLFTRAEVSSV